MLNQRKEFCSWRFMAILTSRGSEFYCTAVTHASGLPRVSEQLCYCRGLTGAKLLLAQLLAHSPGGAFGVVLHCLGRAKSVWACHPWFLEQEPVQSSEQLSFSFFYNLPCSLCFGLTTDIKPPERPGSTAKLYIEFGGGM